MKPPLTLRAFVTVYLAQRYGLKGLRAQQEKLIYSAVKAFEDQDVEVKCFAKILGFTVDEPFW